MLFSASPTAHPFSMLICNAQSFRFPFSILRRGQQMIQVPICSINNRNFVALYICIYWTQTGIMSFCLRWTKLQSVTVTLRGNVSRNPTIQDYFLAFGVTVKSWDWCSSLMLTRLRINRIPIFDDSSNILTPIKPTVKLLHRVRHLVCFSHHSFGWSCLPVFLSHLELFINHLTLSCFLLLCQLPPGWIISDKLFG